MSEREGEAEPETNMFIPHSSHPAERPRLELVGYLLLELVGYLCHSEHSLVKWLINKWWWNRNRLWQREQPWVTTKKDVAVQFSFRPHHSGITIFIYREPRGDSMRRLPTNDCRNCFCSSILCLLNLVRRIAIRIPWLSDRGSATSYLCDRGSARHEKSMVAECCDSFSSLKMLMRWSESQSYDPRTRSMSKS